MKRILSIALLSVFICSTVGVIANSYSCNMMAMKASKCCGMSCCTHEVKLLKLKDDFVSSGVLSIQKNFSPAVILIVPEFTEGSFTPSQFHFSQDDGAPPGRIIDRLSFIQSYLI